MVDNALTDLTLNKLIMLFKEDGLSSLTELQLRCL